MPPPLALIDFRRRPGVFAALAGSFLLFLLATTTAVGQVPAAISAGVSSLTFHRQGGRLWAIIDPKLLDTDVLLHAQVTGVARALADETVSEAGPGLVPALSAEMASGALRLRQERDSLIVLKYAGTLRGRLQYRRQAAISIHRVTAAGAVVIDATPLWEVLEPDRVSGFSSAAEWTTDATEAAAEPRRSAVTPPSPHTVTATRSVAGYSISYRVGVLRLPKVPLQPRLYDPRVGYMFIKAPQEPSGPGSSTSTAGYIARHRLEKSDPTAAISDVVHPILFRITASVPEIWRPYIKEAVEEWNPAFQAIGFRRAIVVLMPDDAPPAATEREIAIRWQNGGQAAATTGKQDPRSGEIISTKIRLDSGGLELLKRNYFTTAGLTDPRARPPMSDSLVGSLLKITVRHEVGHALGLHHNFKGNGYPTDSLRQPSFLHRMGSTPTVMSYVWANYVAQPEDRVTPEDLQPRIGPYDRWAIAWGYRPIPDAATPAAELPTLEQWRAAQDTAPYLRPSLQHLQGRDPYQQQDIIGDDLLKSVEYGVRNMARLAETLKPSLTPAERRFFLGYWHHFMEQVIAVVGGAVPQAPYPRDVRNISLQPIDSAYQVKTIRFLLTRLLYGQDDLMRLIVTNPPKEAGTLLLFDALTPEWEQAQSKPGTIQAAQQNLLTKMLNGWLPRLTNQALPGEPAVLPVLCQELASLEKQLSVAVQEPSASAKQQQAKALQAVVAPVFKPGTGACHD